MIEWRRLVSHESRDGYRENNLLSFHKLGEKNDIFIYCAFKLYHSQADY